jgi:hypothetical protein
MRVSVISGKYKILLFTFNDEMIGSIRVLLVNISIVFDAIKVSLTLEGSFNKPLLLIYSMLGSINILLLNVYLALTVTNISIKS